MHDITPATPDDLDAIRDLHTASWADAYARFVPAEALERLDPEMAERWATLPEGVLCARDGDRLAGFIRLKTRQGWPYIDNLHTRPDLRGQGIGASLMRAGFARLRDEGAGRAWLTVIDGNIAARRFYISQGGHEGARMVERVLGHPTATRPVLWLRLPGQ